MQTQTTTPPAPVKKATAGFIISLIGGIIDAIIALIIIGIGSALSSFGGIPGSPIDLTGVTGGFGLAITTWGAIGLIMSIIVIIGAVLIYMPGKEIIGGILVLIFSIIGFPFNLGGIFIGLILGIVGGALGLAKK